LFRVDICVHRAVTDSHTRGVSKYLLIIIKTILGNIKQKTPLLTRTWFTKKTIARKATTTTTKPRETLTTISQQQQQQRDNGLAVTTINRQLRKDKVVLHTLFIQ